MKCHILSSFVQNCHNLSNIVQNCPVPSCCMSYRAKRPYFEAFLLSGIYIPKRVSRPVEGNCGPFKGIWAFRKPQKSPRRTPFSLFTILILSFGARRAVAEQLLIANFHSAWVMSLMPSPAFFEIGGLSRYFRFAMKCPVLSRIVRNCHNLSRIVQNCPVPSC